MDRKKKILVIHIGAPVLAGALFYYLFLPDTVFVKFLDRIFPFSCHVSHEHFSMAFRLFRNYGLDMLWAYALTFMLSIIFGPEAGSMRKALLLSVVFQLVIEFTQRIPVIPGTFDIWDIIAEAAASLIAAFMIKRIFKGERK